MTRGVKGAVRPAKTYPCLICGAQGSFMYRPHKRAAQAYCWDGPSCLARAARQPMTLLEEMRFLVRCGLRDRRWTQQDLAEHSGIRQQGVATMLTGTSVASVDQWERLIRAATGCTDRLMRGSP
jgi:hypothetical protein